MGSILRYTHSVVEREGVGLGLCRWVAERHNAFSLMIGFVFLPARVAIDFACEGRGTEVEGITQGFVVLLHKVTTKK